MAAAKKKNTKPKPNGKRGRGQDRHAQWRHDSAAALMVYDYTVRRDDAARPIRDLDKLLDSLEQRDPKGESTLTIRTTDRVIEIVREEREEFQRRLRELPGAETIAAQLDYLAQLDADLNLLRQLLARLPWLRDGLRVCFLTAYGEESVSFSADEVATQKWYEGRSMGDIRATFPVIDSLQKQGGSRTEEHANKALRKKIERHREKTGRMR